MTAPPDPQTNQPTPPLARLAAGDPAALAGCIDRYGALVWSLAKRLLADRQAAAAAVGDVFAALRRGEFRYRAGQDDRAVVVALTRSLLFNRRSAADRQALLASLPDDLRRVSSHAQISAAAEGAAATAARAWRALDDDRREALALATLLCLDYDSLAQGSNRQPAQFRQQVRGALFEVCQRMAGSSQ